MKGIFLVFHGFASYNGISKKIFYQRDALAKLGIDIRLCYLTMESDGRQKRMIDEQALEDFGTGLRAKIRKRLGYRALERYIAREDIRFVYMRSDHNASPTLIRLLRRLRKKEVRVFMEIPTYPYDREYLQSSRRRKLSLAVDRCFRERMARYIDRIVTFTDYTSIFGVPTVCISNGIDFPRIPVKRTVRDTSRELNLIGVAEIHFWHGFDRVIEGLAAYYAVPRARTVRFHIVGEGVAAERQRLRDLAAEHGLQDKVLFYGTRSGEGLDEVFERCDMGIASLGRHRSGITKIKTLKNREYAARGIPFVYSETDDDFDAMPYVWKAPADETPLDIDALLRFYDSVAMPPEAIRASISGTLSWETQMKKVTDALAALTQTRRP